tara:strand:- start:249 stop:398 length:150 start_codon:yes stop_codon:yes gene_type:complete
MLDKAIHIAKRLKAEAKFCCAFSMDKEDVQQMLEDLLEVLQKIKAQKHK